jgi:hypothetical protein
MTSLISNLVNTGFGWSIVTLSVIGYFLTYKRTGEKWAFWWVLAVGWGFFALSQTLMLGGAEAGSPYLAVLLLTSAVLVIYAMVLLFLKLVKAR